MIAANRASPSGDVAGSSWSPSTSVSMGAARRVEHDVGHRPEVVAHVAECALTQQI